ncbi:MAG: CinA family nicotinamide mononucleotide deamidase-related protein [Elusimicrobia bacterium]|nr:CinA family nicotinamide mononucleotide deamidase-related protein [Elusimicrobiota bacterium]
MARSLPAAVVELLCVGTELLDGRPETHRAALALRLGAAGLRLSRATILPDDADALAGAVRAALQRCDALIVCGGLGPTFDDLTREAVARALGRDLVFSPRLYAGIRLKFARLGTRLPRENRRQAFLVRGAAPLANRVGSAPGQVIVVRRRGGPPQTVALLPGPPRELLPLFDCEVLPRLRRAYARGLHAATLDLHFCGLPESAADERLKPLTRQAGPELDFTILAGPGQVDFHVLARCSSARRARGLIARCRRQALRLLAGHVVGEGALTLEAAVGGLLRRRRLTLAAAESCTAGLLSGRLTSVPGSSDYFRGGVLAYHDSLKRGLLGVRAVTLARAGAVSAACAREMAAGARRVAGADVGVSVTGVAGSSGGTAAKPVGLVFAAVAGPGAGIAVRRWRLSGDRETVRQRAVAAALRLLWLRLRR